jgi:hypothetical protein
MGIKHYSKERITEIVKNMFPGNELMFIYYCGSISFKTSQRNSDIDVTAVFKDLQGIVHASVVGMDIFAYGLDSFLARQSINDELPLYNLIHADDIINATDNIIFVDPLYEEDLTQFISFDFTQTLPQFLDAFITYYDQLTNQDKAVVKRSYHILRIRGILDNYLLTGKYDIELSDTWIEKIKIHKRQWNKVLNNLDYLAEVQGYIEEIKAIRHGINHEN